MALDRDDGGPLDIAAKNHFVESRPTLVLFIDFQKLSSRPILYSWRAGAGFSPDLRCLREQK